MEAAANFPSFSEGLSLREAAVVAHMAQLRFPFLFGGTFIEGKCGLGDEERVHYFPSFSEGLSLRVWMTLHTASALADFPSFSEGLSLRESHATGRSSRARQFPFLFGGTFIEGGIAIALLVLPLYFPSFSEGLSLRGTYAAMITPKLDISLPFRRDFH